MKDPFENRFLDIDFDTTLDGAEAWQAALKTDEAPEQVAQERTANSARLRLFYLIAAFVVLILLGRTLTLQILNSDQNRALAEGNRVRETDIRAPRGVIYDSKRTIVARNVPNFEVSATPSELPKKGEDRMVLYSKLSEILKKPPQEIAAAAESKGLRYGQQVLVADKLDQGTATLAIMRQNEMPGIHVDDNPERRYETPQEFAHLIGYTGRVSEDDLKRNPEWQASDYVGKSGLEVEYEPDLRGTNGKRRVEVNAQGQAVKELQSSDPTSGKNLVLGVDPDLQRTMYAAVENGVRSSKRAATGGSAIAINPKNGEVLGMVSTPSFDNNSFVNGIKEDNYRALADNPRKPLFNRPVSGEYPPGSTFKIVTATAALAEGIISPGTYLSSPGFITVAGSQFVDWDKNGHGSVNVVSALEKSSDVYFYKVSGGFDKQKGVGEQKLGDYMRQYSIGSKSGIDIPGEKTGLVPTAEWKEDTFNEPWFIGNTYQMGIGQGFVLTTPLQVANYTAAIAGNGIAYKPHLVKAVEDADNPANNRAIQAEPLVNLKVDKTVIQSVQDGMRAAVKTGTARELSTLPVEICGKTGSAEFANETNAHAWFTAYAPCNDPQIVLTVMIEGGGEGSDVAVPAAKTILEKFFNLQAPPASPAPAARRTP